MTKALVCVDDATYGGVYYCANFTTMGAQPVWAKLTVTGLPSLETYLFQVDPDDPLNKQYVGFQDSTREALVSVYYRDGGNWSKIIDDTTIQTATSNSNAKLGWFAVDPSSGTIYASTRDRRSTVPYYGQNYLFKSVDHGANWTYTNGPGSSARGESMVQANGSYIGYSWTSNITELGHCAMSDTGGAGVWSDIDLNTGGAGLMPINLNHYNPTICYTLGNNGGQDLVKIVITGGVAAMSVVRVGGYLEYRTGMHVIDTVTAGRQVFMYFSTSGDIVYTANTWATEGTTAVTGEPVSRCVLAGSQNEGSTGMLIGDEITGRVFYLASETDGTAENRSGANAGAPYADSLPNEGKVAIYGIWFGETPVSIGVLVYSVEEDDINTMPSYTGLGTPMFGDRSSWRDLDVEFDLDGNPLADYHAQDIQKDTPQRHAPWSATPPAAGYGIVSDGTKWIISTDVLSLGGDVKIFGAETGNSSEIERQLIVGGESGGVLEGCDMIGYTDIANPVIAVGAGGSSDESIREIGNVLYEPNETVRKYKTLYTGYSGVYEGGAPNERLHYAYSEDGITWTKYASNPVIAARAEDPYLVRRSGIYYVYFEDKQNQGATGRIRRYKSVDCITWTDEGQITGLGDCQSPVVWLEGDTWYLLYERWPDPGNEDVMLATSTNGLAWTAEASNPVFLDTDTTWGNGAFVPDDIFRVGGTYYLSYHGYDGANYQQGLAKSTNLTAWTDLGIVTTTAAAALVHAQIFYDTRFTFLYYLSDSSGIYRGFPVVPILTLAGDAITILSDWYILASQSGTADDLATINGGVYGQFLLIEPDTGDTITVKHGTGNIYLNGGLDIALSGNESLLLHFDGTYWSDVDDSRLVTLDADAAVLLDITGQELGLDTQTANYIFAGPSSGAANEPTFRAMVEADLPAAFIATLHEHITNEDHSGDCDGAETNFITILAFRDNSTQVYLNGIRQRLYIDYTEAATFDSITFTTAPEAGDVLIIDYIITYSEYQTLDALLLETGDYLLTETGDHLLLES